MFDNLTMPTRHSSDSFSFAPPPPAPPPSARPSKPSPYSAAFEQWRSESFPAMPQTVGDVLAEVAQGSKSVFFYDRRGELLETYSHKQIHADALQAAYRLIASGVRRGDRIAIVAETSPEFITLFFGAIYSGAWPVPLPLPASFSGSSYAAHLESQCRSCEPTKVFAPREILEILYQHSETRALPLLDWSEFLSEKAAEIELPKPRDDNEICYLQYSSGSTRFPKGIMITHKALLNQTLIANKGMHVDRDRNSCVSWLPWYHDMGLVGFLLSTTLYAVDSHFMKTADFARRPLSWLDIISKVDKNAVTCSPSFGYDICARRAPDADAIAERFDLSNWDVAGNGADMIRLDIMQRFIDVFAPAGFKPTSFVSCYGLAETTLAVACVPPGEGLQYNLVEESKLLHRPRGDDEPQRYRAVVNCGKILDGVEMEIRDEAGNVLPDRDIGKVWCKGEILMSGYYRAPEETAECLVDGWLDTGDMGYLSEGCIYIVGRYKDMIILNGRNYWPQDIEWAAEQVEGLKTGDIASFAVTTAEGEEKPTILVQCRVGDSKQRRTLVESVKDKVAAATGLICQVFLVAPKSLPLTSSGKLSRSKACAQYLSGEIQPMQVELAD